MKKVGIWLLSLLFLIALGYVGIRYLDTEDLKKTSFSGDEPMVQYEKVEDNPNYLEPVTVGPQPSFLDKDGNILSAPHNALYSTNPNK